MKFTILGALVAIPLLIGVIAFLSIIRIIDDTEDFDGREH